MASSICWKWNHRESPTDKIMLMRNHKLFTQIINSEESSTMKLRLESNSKSGRWQAQCLRCVCREDHSSVWHSKGKPELARQGKKGGKKEISGCIWWVSGWGWTLDPRHATWWNPAWKNKNHNHTDSTLTRGTLCLLSALIIEEQTKSFKEREWNGGLYYNFIVISK